MTDDRYCYRQSPTAWWTAEVVDNRTGHVVDSYAGGTPEGLVSALHRAKRRVAELSRSRPSTALEGES